MTTGDQRYDVIVAGGGLVGLTLGLALSRAFQGELRVAVIDPGPLSSTGDRHNDARASAIGAGSRRLLTTLGVWPQLAHAVQNIDTIEITDSRLADGIRPVLLSYEASLDTGEPAMSIVANDDLMQALRVAANAAPGLRLIEATRVSEAARHASGADVHLSDGHRLVAPLIVAADGRASPLRVAAGIKTVGWPHDQIGIVATIAHELPHRRAAVQHFLPGGPFAILPLPGNRSCITWSESKNDAHRLLAAPDQVFIAAVDLRVGGKLGRIEVVSARQHWPLDTFLARSIIADRLALIGDAARGVHPIAGQGLNLGFRDVAALSETIVDAARAGQDIGSSAILERYERWRRADGVMAAGSFDAMNRLFSNDLAGLRTLRDAGLGVVDRMPALKRRFILEAAGLTGTIPRLLQGLPL